MNQSIKENVIELLRNRGAYHCGSNGRQHYTRCPFCGDSRNLSHAHLSVKIDLSNDQPMVYRCLKCGVSGLFTSNTLEEMDIYVDPLLRQSLKIYNKKAMRVGKLVNLEFEKFKVPLSHPTQLTNQKLQYLNDRLGTSYEYRMAQDDKVILSLKDFMEYNDISQIPDMSYNMMNYLDYNYIGFLSCNNNCITFRDITGEQKYRYFKVVLNPRNVNPDSFYAMPNQIALMYTNDIDVHLTEGIFDILSVRHNLVQKSENNFYYAICGFGCVTTLKYLIHHGINTGINLHIYADNDKTDFQQRKSLFNKDFYLYEWIDHIHFHRNGYKNEKDYGVPMSRIIDTRRRIK